MLPTQDFDNSFIGQSVIQGLVPAGGTITWTVVPAANFPNGVAGLANAVVEERCWVAVASAFTSSFVASRHY
jgi:hypothetical protein